jgi:hypothetical protein
VLASAMSLFPTVLFYRHYVEPLPFNSLFGGSSSTNVSRETSRPNLHNLFHVKHRIQKMA